jgi:hypothetical protein
MTKLLDVSKNKYIQCDEFGHFRIYEDNTIDNTRFNFLRKENYYHIRVQRKYREFENLLFYVSICKENRDNNDLYYICADISYDFFESPPDSKFRIVIKDENNRTVNIYDNSNDRYVYYDSNYQTYMVGKSNSPSIFKVEDENEFNSLYKNCEENSIYNKTTGNCEKCTDGKIPNLTKSECITPKYSCDTDCNPSLQGDIFTFDECISVCPKPTCTGNNIYTRNRTACVGCDYKVPNADHTQCVDAKFSCSTRCNQQLTGEYNTRSECVKACGICEGNTIKSGNECVDCGIDKYANEDNTRCMDYKYDCNNDCEGSVYGKYDNKNDCLKGCKGVNKFGVINFLNGKCEEKSDGFFTSDYMCETTIKLVIWVPISIILIYLIFILLKKILL